MAAGAVGRDVPTDAASPADFAVSAADQSRLRSRRALLAGAGAAGAMALAGCGGKPLREKIRGGGVKVPPEDVSTLNALLDVENFGIAAYAAGIPLLSETVSTSAKWFLGQELAHAAELADLIKQAGAKPHKLGASYPLGDPRTPTEALALLQRAEHAQLHAYLEMIPTLSDGHVRAAIATISANDAQHLALLRSSGGQMPTQAFPVG